jgi:ribonucleoside-diphosphate reductase alpha chain
MDNNSLISDYTQWERGKDYPDYFDEISLATISKGYLLPGETPKKAYRRVSIAAATRLNRPDLENKFFKILWNGWLGLASPVLSNMGTDRGLPISCFGVDTPDSIRGIGLTNAELMKLTSVGGGVGISLSRIRPRGREIKGNGKSEGVVPWAKIYDSTIIATNQGNVRRGAASVNLDINHADIDEFLEIRRPKGDPNRQCLNLHQCVVVDDVFMRKLESRDQPSMERWAKVLKARMETGEPYIMFKDNVNKANPIAYMMNNLDVSMTNICTEITLHTDEEHSFICCLSSLNLAKYDEWKDTDTVQL